VPAASTDAGSSASSGTQISDFDDVSDDVSWSTPVQVPEMETAIAGGDDSILGTWRQSGCHPAVRRTYDAPCVHLVIERDSTGNITGSVNFDKTEDRRGPFPPVTDADVGYPPDVDASQYADLINNAVSGVPYRMYAASLRDGHLRFQWSSLEPWNDWCRLQTPYPWHLGDHQGNFCVPQDEAARTRIDPGKVLLCADPNFLDLCTVNGSARPCVCEQRPYCNTPVCHCDDRACSADVYSYFHGLQDFLVDGARMSGDWSVSGDLSAMTFERVEP
jgi:hypothetical protein